MLVCAWLPLTRAAAAQTPVSCCRRTSAAMRIATSYDRLFELPVGGTFVPAFLLHASRAASAPRLMPGTRANAACHCRGLFSGGCGRAGSRAGRRRARTTTPITVGAVQRGSGRKLAIREPRTDFLPDLLLCHAPGFSQVFMVLVPIATGVWLAILGVTRFIAEDDLE